MSITDKSRAALDKERKEWGPEALETGSPFDLCAEVALRAPPSHD